MSEINQLKLSSLLYEHKYHKVILILQMIRSHHHMAHALIASQMNFGFYHAKPALILVFIVQTAEERK